MLKHCHVTLALKAAEPRLEVQLLHFLKPPVKAEGDIGRLDRIGFNHICFAVSDIDGMIAKVTAQPVCACGNQPMTFHGRRLVFLEGPQGITVELAEWKQPITARSSGRAPAPGGCGNARAGAASPPACRP